ncbi:MAG: PAS domain S-box protein, partial [Draconibacterium sp.]|nr:PAS domain S-box protein [Draconibacterium sp.]
MKEKPGQNRENPSFHIYPEIPEDIYSNWQRIVDLMAGIINVPAGLIMHVHPTQIEVFVTSNTDGNPYKRGKLDDLNIGLYCERVMSERKPLHITDALADPDWNKNPDIELDMISYLGYPLFWPDGTIFGTICVLDNKKHIYTNLQQELVQEFSNTINLQLKTLAEDAETEQLEYKGKFHSVFESSRDAKILLQDNKFIDCNGAALKMFGYTKKEDFINKHPGDVSPPVQSDGSSSKEKADKIIDSALHGESGVFEWIHRRKDGTDFPSEIILSPLKWKEKDILLAIIRDITDRKLIEEEKFETLSRFSGFAETSQYGMGIADLEGRIVYVNTALVRMLGEKTAKDCIGKTFLTSYYTPPMIKKLQNEVIPTLLDKGNWHGE